MPASVQITIEDPSQSAQARRIAMRLAEQNGFDEVRAGQVGIVVTEACTNILKHAGSGEILIQLTDPGSAEAVPDFEMLAVDKGPGMDNLEKCLRDGFSTGGSPGQGLGAIQRLSDESDFYSARGEGTTVLARWHGTKRPAGATAHQQQIRLGAVNVPKRGEEFCGDSWGVEHAGCTATIMVADGLGHGYEASLASLGAVHILRKNRESQPGVLINLAHHALRSLRGAAVSVARIDATASTITFSGLGNVMAQIYTGSQRAQHLVSVNGTAGHHAARIREFSYDWPKDGILVIYSDGLATSTSLEARPGLTQRDPSLIAAVLYRDFARGHDDATVVVAKAVE